VLNNNGNIMPLEKAELMCSNFASYLVHFSLDNYLVDKLFIMGVAQQAGSSRPSK
jgi:hypothetical protein